MSYDFYVMIDTGGPEPHCIEPYFSDEHPAIGGDGIAGVAVVTSSGYARCGNYTSNVSGMWAKCLTAALERGLVPDAPEWAGEDGKLRLRDLQDKRADVVAPLLAVAVEWGIAHLDELREMNPDNGWGDAEGAVTYLWDIARFCERHPKGTLHLSY